MVVLKMLTMEITNMRDTDIDFEDFSDEEKFEYLYKMLNSIKPECFADCARDASKLKSLGDFWVNLKDAEEYYWDSYDYEDFVVGVWTTDPNKLYRSNNACERRVAYLSGLKCVSANCADDWAFSEYCEERPEWFTQDAIDNGHIWVKPLIAHGKY
jgi:hypothetical protein